MLTPSSKKPGVAAVLVSKQLSLSLRNNLYIVSYSDTFFKVGGLVPTSDKKHVILLASSPKEMQATPNYGLTYRCRPAHAEVPYHPRLPLACKLSWFFSKFRYTGKGLKVKKGSTTTTVLFNLGASHISKIHYTASRMQILRTKKNTYTMLSTNKNNLVTNQDIRVIRPYNRYTRRGLRLNRQPVERRFGKVSQVASKKK